MTLLDELARLCADAISALHDVEDLDVARTLAKSREDVPADYQLNAAFQLAKQLKRPPRDVAAGIAEKLNELGGPVAHAEAAGPGFVNITLSDPWLLDRARSTALPAADQPEHVLIDFSSPNVAKEMHVGHLRTTIIGDALARMHEALGHEVERISHLGDWGTQFGMLIEHLREQPGDLQDVQLGDLDRFYKEAKERFDTDEAFRGRAREAVVLLQGGDDEARRAWDILCAQSHEANQHLYDLLDVRVEERGESFYQPMLQQVVDDLSEAGLLVEDDGALVVFLDEFTNKSGEPLPLIVRKSDGGFNYATTDLAAVRHRVRTGVKRVLYVVDAGQSQHFQMVFETARRAGWIPDDVHFEHVPFGLVLGEDGKRLRTRSGETPKLRDLVDAAVSRATVFVRERAETARGARGSAPPERVGHILGISSLRYAELSHNRMTDYVFSLDKMVSLHGNTAPYLLYVYARIAGIVEAAANATAAPAGDRALSAEERALTLHLAGFQDAVAAAIANSAPNYVAEFLFGLCQAFNRFYEGHRVIDGDVYDPVRLQLCEASAGLLESGFALLGVEVVSEL